MDFVELRSDTCTLPTEEMREAMRNAEVGDDVLGEDPTVARLEAMAASKVGKEAALFCPSGTMGNLVAIMTHCGRGDEAIMESECHIYYYEVGGMSAIAGVVPRLVRGMNGVLDPADVKAAIREKNIHYAPAACLCIENTHNRGGGTVTDIATMTALGAVARENGLAVHMDGARIFNASIALDVDPADLARPADSVMFCLSKGLSAPVGSMLAGSAEFIARARKNRKIVGGGMRQAGVLAAAGIVALEKMIGRLAEDHANARAFAEGLSQIPGISINTSTVQTNIVVFDISALGIGSSRFASELEALGVKVSTRPPEGIRAVANRHFTAKDVNRALDAVMEISQRRLR
ncbi:MAG: GntG family PLP-dependent aldolase [Clostridia bacterium]|nr:GntG family PLP-dependent aldolase [Clostridia bacterium]